jgi:hypothetical protein
MASGKIPGARKVPVKEVRELSKLPWVRDEALSSDAHEARVLPDGRVLLYWGERAWGNLYPSREVLAQMQQESAEALAKVRAGYSPAQELLPPIDDFLRDVEAHARSLGPRLRIPDEVLDFTPASLDAVDKALKRIPWAKRQVPDLVTPLVAYLGEVVRRATGGQWEKAPTTRQQQVPIYDPVELAALDAALRAATPIANAAGDKAAAEAKAGRASAGAVLYARRSAEGAVYREVRASGPEPIRMDVIEVPIAGRENLPMVTASGGRIFDPFADVYLPMVEPSRRIPLRSSTGVPHPRPPKPEP